MKLIDYLKENNIRRVDFAKSIACSYNYLGQLLQGRKPGPKVVKLIEKITKKKVKKDDLLRQENIDNRQKKQNIKKQNHVHTPSELAICSQSKDERLPNIFHKKPLVISLVVNDSILFTKEIHE